MPEPTERHEYLRRVANRLRLDPDTETDVLDELERHLQDSFERHLGEGKPPDRAERESLRRLGDPERLAAEIRRVHQTRRRLLAAVGGGVFGAADGAARAFGATLVSMIAAMFLGMLAVQAWASATDGSPGYQLGFLSLPWGLMLATPLAFGAARRATAAAARRSRRPLDQAARAVGLIGAVALALPFLFLLRPTMNVESAVVETAVVVAWLAGAASVGRIEDVSFSRRTWLLAVALLGSAVFLALGPLSAPYDDTFPDNFAPDLSRVGVVLDEDSRPVRWEHEQPEGVYGVVIVRFAPPDFAEELSSIPAGWTDGRLELWPALPRTMNTGFPTDDVGELDPAFSAPVRIEPLVLSNDRLAGAIRFDDLRGLDRAWVIATVSVDGQRTVIYTNAVVPNYRATLAEWLLSFLPGSPSAIHPG